MGVEQKISRRDLFRLGGKAALVAAVPGVIGSVAAGSLSEPAEAKVLTNPLSLATTDTSSSASVLPYVAAGSWLDPDEISRLESRIRQNGNTWLVYSDAAVKDLNNAPLPSSVNTADSAPSIVTFINTGGETISWQTFPDTPQIAGYEQVTILQPNQRPQVLKLSTNSELKFGVYENQKGEYEVIGYNPSRPYLASTYNPSINAFNPSEEGQRISLVPRRRMLDRIAGTGPNIEVFPDSSGQPGVALNTDGFTPPDRTSLEQALGNPAEVDSLVKAGVTEVMAGGNNQGVIDYSGRDVIRSGDPGSPVDKMNRNAAFMDGMD